MHKCRLKKKFVVSISRAFFCLVLYTDYSVINVNTMYLRNKWPLNKIGLLKLQTLYYITKHGTIHLLQAFSLKNAKYISNILCTF